MSPREVICLLASVGSMLQPIARDIVLLFARITIGSGFFLIGKGKLANLEKTTGLFESLGIPAPGFHANFVGGLEMVGGILLVVGLLSRAAAVPLVIAMTVAYLTAHREQAFRGINEFTDEAPFAFLLVSLVILAFGPGRVALDHLVNGIFCKNFGNE